MAGSLAIMKLVQDYNLDINSPIEKHLKNLKELKWENKNKGFTNSYRWMETILSPNFH